MTIGETLKNARVTSGMTQEQVAERIQVSRQTISNWENEKSYPDIMSVIRLSDLYAVSLDQLLKGDEGLVKHLEESTNTVRETRKMILIMLANLILMAVLIISVRWIPQNTYYLVGVFILLIIGMAALLYQIVKRI
ncbi:MAG: helix-turn-helix domain-containing protein [Roseburia sp.]